MVLEDELVEVMASRCGDGCLEQDQLSERLQGPEELIDAQLEIQHDTETLGWQVVRMRRHRAIASRLRAKLARVRLEAIGVWLGSV